MPRFSFNPRVERPGPVHADTRVRPPADREGSDCDLYAPGHLIHYRHQADAVHSPSQVVRSAMLDGSWLLLTLDDGRELRWRHHDPARLSRMLELLRGRCVAYPGFHALRIGPYWFNCATDADEWHDCRVAVASSHG